MSPSYRPQPSRSQTTSAAASPATSSAIAASLSHPKLITVELVPMQISESAKKPQSLLTNRHALLPPTLTTNLSIQPGELSELVIRIKNHTEAPLQLDISVLGDFPSDWWQLRTEGQILPAQHQMEAVLYLAIAADFFERPLSPNQLPLQLTYPGQIKVTGTTRTDTAPTSPKATGTKETDEKETDRKNQSRSQQQINPFQLNIEPHSLYLDYLPDIYRNVDFVGRFLKIFETTFEPTVDILDQQWAYLDPLTAPQSMLPFLAHWVAWSFDGPLSLSQQRVLIRYAMEIYRWRGTRRGLRFYLHLASGLPLDDHLSQEADKSISIYENFSPGHILGKTVLGHSTILGGHKPYHFSVQLHPTPDTPTADQLDETLIRTIIEQEKPAFSSYDLSITPRI